MTTLVYLSSLTAIFTGAKVESLKINNNLNFLEAQLFCNYIDVTDSLPLSVITIGRIVLSAIYPLLWIDLDVRYGLPPRI